MKVAPLVKIHYKKLLNFLSQNIQNKMPLFSYIVIFKDVPRWLETKEESKKAMLMKSKMLMYVGTSDSLDKSLKIEIGIEHTNDYNEHKVLKRPQGSRTAKDKFKICVMRECAIKAQAKATTDMTVVTLKKT